VLELLFAIIVFAVVGYVFWDRVRHEPPGAPRRLALAAIFAMSGALAATGHRTPWPLIVGAWLLTFALIAAADSAASRARDRAP
jgi:hypothetical protein